MTKTTCLLLAVAATGGDLLAQSNERGAGYNGALANISSATYNGRRGATYPNGEMAVTFQNQLCNPGSIPIEWQSPGGFVGAGILADHPKFGFLVARETNGRFLQVSDWSYCKHAFLSTNAPSACGGSCTQPPNGGAQLGVSCSDVYSPGNNGNRTYLGPPAEINPWLGTWNPLGSYFDVGDPQTGIGPADGIRSLITTGFDNVKNRVTIRETDIQGPAGVPTNLYFQIYVLHEGERVENRDNNIMSRPFTVTWTGSTWTTSTTGTATFGSILSRWTGSTMSIGGNGTGVFTDADGRFAVAVKVTGPTNGFWHYEYAVQNIDNNRGGASFRLPVCGNARVQNLGFHDVDANPLNNWTTSVTSNEIAFLATAGNAHRWNQLLNFWFDCDTAPIAGNATIDQADPGPGASTLSLATQVPGLQPSVHLGAGCGTPATEIFGNGIPAAGNSAFAFDGVTDPSTLLLVLFSDAGASLPLGSGCTFFLDLATMGDIGFYVADGVGNVSIPIAVPPGLTPVDVFLQAATFIPNPPLFNVVGLSNGLKVRFAGTGCN